ncbi:aldo/keto reductase [Pantoea sp. Bo_2]|uniref:Aldo/keto reductase n=1 Tax=Candidatus Pantoea gossypiicola TaxID=2608008 RepID=A0AB34CFY2_9GAMM|nr:MULTISPECIES: aldo/keto reductase [Pantoea]KAA5927803.1 aldo/keto reductase [Pantoea sp. VH_8]KAA5932533.1 aldo/keto reductase [Pantoea sp. VH_4]KAA5939274.1 aldo/keto reductase [Pantoea sp. VH_3]KAA5948153.1 aldo/keto reductase [Pantoea sp. VH_25]KAA5957124.1 aldo/keto reductase [Pantoea sp. VH_16]
MQYTRLGKSDLLVSRICMGCMGFGNPLTGQHRWTLDETESRNIIRHGLEQGINFYDTAIAYQNGSSERYVGRALRDMAKREEVVLATKFLPRTPAQIAEGISGKAAITRSLDQSLQNLGMDYIDLYVCHIWDYNTPIIDVLEALHDAVTAGKVRATGISNCYAWQLAKANALARHEGLTPFVSMQSHYNLIMREDERELFGLCAEEDIALTPYSALASGRLSRKEGHTRRAIEDDYARGKYDSTAEQDRIIIERIAELAERHQISMTEISLAWLLTKVTSPVVGATKKEHVDGAVNAVNLRLDPEEIRFLEETYQPHVLTGIMAQNTPQTKDAKQVWTR